MRLIAAVLGFLGKKFLTFAVVVVSLLIGILVIQSVVPSLQQVGRDREQLERTLEKQQQLQSDLRRQREDLQEKRDDICGFKEKVEALIAPGNFCKAAQKKLDDAEGELNATTEKIRRTKAEVQELKEREDSWAAKVVSGWEHHGRWILTVAAIVLFLPPLLRLLAYFVLMPAVVRTHRRIRLAEPGVGQEAELHTGDTVRTLSLALEAGEVLSARSEYVRPVSGERSRGRLLYDWKAPFVSFAAGLYGLTQVRGGAERPALVALTAPDDPDAYVKRIDFSNHPGVVMRPRHVIGVIGKPQLKVKWRWGIQALATWQVRYIMFAGTGSLIVRGGGDVNADTPGGDSRRMDQNLLMGFDSRLTVGVNRTDVFWPYLWGRRPLVDDEFFGEDRFFWQKSTTEGSQNPITKVFNAFFSSLGKLLGF